MSLHTFGTTSSTALQAIQFTQAVSDADIAAIATAITSDIAFGTVPAGFGTGAQGVLATGTLNATTAVSAITRTGGGALATIAVGNLVLGVGIVPGTFVSVVGTGGTSVTLSQAATGNAAGVNLCFVPNNNDVAPAFSRRQLLFIPMRGVIKVLPNDVVAVDPNTGAVVLVPGNAVSAAGSIWSFV